MGDAAAASDADLMRRAAGGDREAFAVLYRRHHPTVYRFARLMTGSTVVAEDVVQDVFLALMRDPARYDEAKASLTTYLYGVARYCTRRRLARDGRLVALDETPHDAMHIVDEVQDALVRRDEVQRLRRAIVSLPSRYREVVVLCELQDVSYADAAATVGCAIGTIRSRLYRARLLLAEKMQRSSKNAPRSRLRYAV